jgi:hypothetical protein
MALSRHVLHVHKYLSTPALEFKPLEPAVIKQYIAAARNMHPVVPVELTSYIVEAYVSLRTQDTRASHSSSRSRHSLPANDQTVMTARQLLSILRLSQALARLRFSETVSHEDVDEAIRLVSSLSTSSPSLLPSSTLLLPLVLALLFCSLFSLDPRLQGLSAGRHDDSLSRGQYLCHLLHAARLLLPASLAGRGLLAGGGDGDQERFHHTAVGEVSDRVSGSGGAACGQRQDHHHIRTLG